MADIWFRMDNTAIIHPKLANLTDRELRACLALWSFCSRRNNEGLFTVDDLPHIVYGAASGPRSMTDSELKKMVRSGLVDALDGHSFQVHEWRKYQPKDPDAAVRKRRQRLRERDVEEV